MTTLFQDFPKMGRLNREAVITEKIDGTNAQVLILSRAEYDALDGAATQGYRPLKHTGSDPSDLVMFAGSRTRIIEPGKTTDNFGFAGWVFENADALFALGVGRHFGEWWGKGIQRGYGLADRQFSLFNTLRWTERPSDLAADTTGKMELVPSCCKVVPVLYRGQFDTQAARAELDRLAQHGSVAAPGFKDPEGIVVYHIAAGVGFKATCKNDETPKSLVR